MSDKMSALFRPLTSSLTLFIMIFTLVFTLVLLVSVVVTYILPESYASTARIKASVAGGLAVGAGFAAGRGLAARPENQGRPEVRPTEEPLDARGEIWHTPIDGRWYRLPIGAP